MKVLILQHESDTPAGSTLLWLKLNHINYQLLMAPEVNAYPELNSFDGLIVLGGSMNVDEESLHPWLKLEKEFLRKCLNANKKILGLCLGSQLLAEALGASVQSMKKWEIGWFDIQTSDGERVPAFHWHQYNFAVPAGASPTASSEACANQGYKFKDHVLAYQFHPEVDQQWIELALKDWRNQDLPGAVQSSTEILKQNHEKLPQTQQWYFQQLKRFFIPVND